MLFKSCILVSMGCHFEQSVFEVFGKTLCERAEFQRPVPLFSSTVSSIQVIKGRCLAAEGPINVYGGFQYICLSAQFSVITHSHLRPRHLKPIG